MLSRPLTALVAAGSITGGACRNRVRRVRGWRSFGQLSRSDLHQRLRGVEHRRTTDRKETIETSSPSRSPTATS